MAKLMMLRSLPAGGKTTIARRMVKDNWFRLNRDDLRASLYAGSEWSPKREQAVIAVQRAAAKELLGRKESVVIDDTNLSQHHLDSWKNLAAEVGATFDMEVVPTPVQECIRRDSLRDGKEHVGESVIWKLATQNGWFSWGDEPIVVVDVDGTLADGERRNHLLADKTNPNRWKEYFAAVGGDKPVEFVARWVRELSKEYRIVIVSGRPDNFKLSTHAFGFDMEWTMATETSQFVRNRCGIPYHSLFMRAQGDKRPDTDVKRDILKRNLKGANIAFVLDDRPKVIKEVWREAGIKCYPVRGAVEDF